MSDISLGTISASIQLRFQELLAGAAKATAAFTKMGDDMEEAASGTASAVEESFAGMAGILGGIGIAAAAALGAIVSVGSEMQQTLLHVAANTNMSNDALEEMTKTINTMAGSSAADFKQLADGYMHVTNFGFQAAESTKILNAAMESALATGADVGKTANVLAATMHEFSIPVEQASRAMNELHTASALGNTTLEQFVESAGRAHSMAANLGVPLVQVDAAMTALTQHGLNAAQAATGVANIMAHMVAPSEKVSKILAEVSKRTGVDLVSDFTLAGVRGKGFTGILADIATAAHKAGMSASDLAFILIPAMRGGREAMALAGTAAEDYRKDLAKLTDAMAGRTNPTAEQFAREQATIAYQFKQLKNEAAQMANSLFTHVEPAFATLIGMARELAQGIRELFQSAAITASIFDPEALRRSQAPREIDLFPGGAERGSGRFAGDPLHRAGWHSDAPAAAAAAGGAMPAWLRDFMHKGGKGSGGDTQREADKAAKGLDDLNEKLKKLADRAFAATHSDFDVQRRDATQQFHEDQQTARGNPRGQQLALDTFTATMRKIRDDEKKSQIDRVNEFMAANKTITDAEIEAAKKVEEHEERLRKGGLQFLEYWQKQAADYALDQWTHAAEAVADKWNATFDLATKESEDDIEEMARAAEALADKWNQAMSGPDSSNNAKRDQQKATWQKMADDAKSILVDGLGRALTNGFKEFFQGILQAFEQMLAQMVAQAVISGIFNMFGGKNSVGGGFLGGFLSVFGFDSGANDLSAKRWGLDFGNLFTQGMGEGARKGASSHPGSGSSGVQIHITGEQHYHNEMDARRVAEVIGDHLSFHTQRRLRSVVGS